MVFFIINFIENITHRAGWPGRPPAPGSLRSGCRRLLRPYNSELCQFCHTLLLICALAMLQKPYNAPNTGRNASKMRYFVLVIQVYTCTIERFKTPSPPLSRGTPQKALNHSIR